MVAHRLGHVVDHINSSNQSIHQDTSHTGIVSLTDSRHADGVEPTSFRNAVVRCDWLANPQSAAISDNDASVSRIIRLAASMRLSFTNRIGVKPMIERNVRAK